MFKHVSITHLVGTALYTRVRTVRTFVGLLAGVTQLVTSQRIVIGRGVLTLVAGKRFFTGVTADVHFQRSPIRSLVAAIVAQVGFQFFVYRVHVVF